MAARRRAVLTLRIGIVGSAIFGTVMTTGAAPSSFALAASLPSVESDIWKQVEAMPPPPPPKGPHMLGNAAPLSGDRFVALNGWSDGASTDVYAGGLVLPGRLRYEAALVIFRDCTSSCVLEKANPVLVGFYRPRTRPLGQFEVTGFSRGVLKLAIIADGVTSPGEAAPKPPPSARTFLFDVPQRSFGSA